MQKEFSLPELGESVTEGTVAKVLVAVGDMVQKDQAVLEIETDKALAEIPCSVAGKVTEIRVSEGQTIKMGDVILVLEADAGATVEEAPKPPAATPKKAEKKAPQKRELPAAAKASAPKNSGAPVLASPTLRRLARELEIDIKAVPTADPSGRVTAEEIRSFAAGGASQEPVATASAPSQASADPTLDAEADRWGTVHIEPMNAVRKKTAEHMSQCWAIPHVTHFDKADLTELEILRKKYAPKVAATGGKLTTISFVLKVVAAALQKFPKFNASLDLPGSRLLLKQYYHIGVAVDTPNGLLVPVLRDVDQKSLSTISAELPALAAKARERKVSLEEMQGGTFTISNLGGLGGTGFTPIINQPEVAILGMSRSTVEPVWRDGDFEPRTLLPLSLSYDHRIIDGADAARFLRWICAALEEPWLLFLED